MKFDDNKTKENAISVLTRKGISLNESGKYEDAISHFNKALSLNPENDTALVDKGYSLEKLQQYNEAIECYNQALAINSNNLEAMHNKGYAFLLLEKYKEALSCFDHVLSVDPKMIKAENGALIASLAIANYERAVSACDNLMKYGENIEFSNAILLIGYYFQEKHHFKLMELFTYLIFGRQPDKNVYGNSESFSLKYIESILHELSLWKHRNLFFNRLTILNSEIYPTQSRELKWLDPILNSLIFSINKNEIIALEKKASHKISSKNEQLHSNGKIREQENQNLQSLELKQKLSYAKLSFKKAWELVFEISCKINNIYYEDSQTLMIEGISYAQREQYIKAINCYKSAVRKNPFNYDAFGNLGITLKRYNFPNLAILCYQESLKIYYLNDKCHHNIGLAFMELNRLDDAIAHFELSIYLQNSLSRSNLELCIKKKFANNLGKIRLQLSNWKNSLSYHFLNKTLLMKKTLHLHITALN